MTFHLAWSACYASWMLVAFCYFLVLPVRAEIAKVKMVMPPSFSTIEMNEAFIKGPGHLDLSRLSFSLMRETDDTASTRNATVIDMAAVRMNPRRCQGKTKTAEQLACAGIGTSAPSDYSLYCCTQVALDRGDCATFGRLIINETLFSGKRRTVAVASSSPEENRLMGGDAVLHLYSSGLYTLVLANCNGDSGEPVRAEGEIIWKSAHGYMYGELFGVMDSFIFLSCWYVVLLVWYGGRKYASTNEGVPAERWILVGIAFGFLNIAMNMTQMSILNRRGYRILWLSIATVFCNSAKQLAARCGGLLLAMGAGSAPRDSATESSINTKPVYRLGMAFLIISVATDTSFAYVVNSFKTHTLDEEKGMLEFTEFLLGVLVVMDGVFFIWTLRAIRRTVTALSTTLNRPKALQRYTRFRTIIRTSIATAIVVSALQFVPRAPLFARRYHGILNVLTETLYVAVFTGVAILWRPVDGDAKDYTPLALVMEEDDENDLYLELTDSMSPTTQPHVNVVENPTVSRN